MQLSNRPLGVEMNVKLKRLLGLGLTVFCLASADAARAQASVERVAPGLESPSAGACRPGQRFLVTERAGRLRVVGRDGRIGGPVSGLPPIAAGGQGGLLDVVTDSAFASNRTVYTCFSEPEVGGSGNSTAVL